jgi:hypothetical protein
MGRREPKSVPIFRSEAEEIEFWETHDVEEYLTGEFETWDQILAPDDVDLVITLRSRSQSESPQHFAMPIPTQTAERVAAWLRTHRAEKLSKRRMKELLNL